MVPERIMTGRDDRSDAEVKIDWAIYRLEIATDSLNRARRILIGGNLLVVAMTGLIIYIAAALI